MFSTISKQSKTNFYNHHFETNWNSIKNTWKSLKFILNIKNISAEIPKTITVDGTTISNPMEISLKRSLIFPFHINIFQIFLKIDLIFPFL